MIYDICYDTQHSEHNTPQIQNTIMGRTSETPVKSEVPSIPTPSAAALSAPPEPVSADSSVPSADLVLHMLHSEYHKTDEVFPEDNNAVKIRKLEKLVSHVAYACAVASNYPECIAHVSFVADKLKEGFFLLTSAITHTDMLNWMDAGRAAIPASAESSESDTAECITCKKVLNQDSHECINSDFDEYFYCATCFDIIALVCEKCGCHERREDPDAILCRECLKEK